MMHALTITRKLFCCISSRDEFECDCSQKRSIQLVLNWSRLSVPRQTRYNWRHAAAESDDCRSKDDGESHAQISADEGCDEIIKLIESEAADDINLIESEAMDDIDLIEGEAADGNNPIKGQHEYGHDRARRWEWCLSWAWLQSTDLPTLADILKVMCLQIAFLLPTSISIDWLKGWQRWVSIQVISRHTDYVESVGDIWKASKIAANPLVKQWTYRWRTIHS